MGLTEAFSGKGHPKKCSTLWEHWMKTHLDVFSVCRVLYRHLSFVKEFPVLRALLFSDHTNLSVMSQGHNYLKVVEGNRNRNRNILITLSFLTEFKSIQSCISPLTCIIPNPATTQCTSHREDLYVSPSNFTPSRKVKEN